MDMEALLQRKMVQCEELEMAESELRTENATMQKRICQFEQERCRHQETLAEMSHASKRLMTTFLGTRRNATLFRKAFNRPNELWPQCWR